MYAECAFSFSLNLLIVSRILIEYFIENRPRYIEDCSLESRILICIIYSVLKIVVRFSDPLHITIHQGEVSA